MVRTAWVPEVADRAPGTDQASMVPGPSIEVETAAVQRDHDVVVNLVSAGPAQLRGAAGNGQSGTEGMHAGGTAFGQHRAFLR